MKFPANWHQEHLPPTSPARLHKRNATQVKFYHNRYEGRTGSDGPGPKLFAFDDELISIKRLAPKQNIHSLLEVHPVDVVLCELVGSLLVAAERTTDDEFKNIHLNDNLNCYKWMYIL